jgi:hypothetical protein
MAAPVAFNVDGVIHKPDGTALEESSVQFSIEVRSPAAAGSCLLYRENQTVDMTGSNGYFSIPLGLGTNVAAGGYSLETVLGSQVMTGLSECAGGTYTPSAADERQLQIIFTENGVSHDFGLQSINAAPYAMTAKNLEGKGASAFVQTGSNTTQTRVDSVFSRYTQLDAILNGTFAGNAATATALATAPGACPAGQYMNAMTASGAITCGTPAAGSVTNVTSANSYLSVATGTSTPVLTVNVGTASGTVAAGDDSRFTDSRAPNGAAGGDLSGTYPNPSVAKVSGKTVTLTSPAAGDLLTYDGTKFINSPPVTPVDATKLPLAGGTMSGAINMGSQNLTNVGFITMSANKSLHLSNNSSDPSGLAAVDKGKMWYNTTTGEIKFWNGSAAQSLGVAGSGLSNFNTQTGSTQTLAIGTSGLLPNWNSASNVHTLNIPMASTASVTAGLLSKADYDAFTAKLDSSSVLAGDVTGTPSTTSVDKIKGKAVTPAAYAAGQTLRYDGTQWVNAVLGFADIGSKPTTLAGYGITDGVTSTLVNGKILVGNGSNVATAVAMSGDATLSNAGVLTLATVPVSKGGTGVTAFTGDRVVTTSAAGALQTTSCSLGQVISFTAGGAITCATPSAGSVTSVTSANSYLTVATGTSTPVLTLNVGTVANTVAAGDDARLSDSRAPSGVAGGDLSGTYPNPTVAKVSGKAVTLIAPAAGDLLTYDGTKFVNSPPAPSFDATKLPLAGGTMSGAIDMGSQNLANVGFITMSANKNLHLSNNTSDPAGLVAADKGKVWFNSTSNQVKYWDGSSAQPLGVAGSGLSNFNTQTGSTQTLAIGTSGLLPNWNSASNVHTLNIPMASTASVTAGLISKTDYDTFNTKLGASTTFSGDVSGAYNATSVDKIKGKAVTPTTYAAGQTLRYDGTQWVNAVLGFADLGSKPSTLAGYGITDGVTSTLVNGKILVGNGSNVATAVAMSGDATLSNAGVLTLATVPISKGGTGLTSFAGDKLVTTSTGGAIQTSFCALNQVISFTAGGAITCMDVSSLVTGFVNGGNSFGAAASLGTNDAFDLTLKTNNLARMTVLSDGKVGVGTTSPSSLLDLNGAFTQRGISAPAVSAPGQGVIYFDSTSNKFRASQNGGAYVDLMGSVGGIVSLGGLTASSQTFAVGTSGLTPAFSSSISTHTLNIPMASATGVTAGLLSKTDYDTFTAKLGSSTTFVGDVTGAYNATSVDKIKGKAVTPVTYVAGQTLRYDGTQWVNAVLGFADLGSKPSTLAGYGITDAQSSTLLDGKILVGNASNQAAAVTLSGDATLSDVGVLSLNTVPISKGGTGLTSFTGDKIVTTSTGGALQTTSCALNQVITFTGGGAIMCANVSALSSSFQNGGNSFGAAATLGTNDPFGLNFETNGTSRMSILSNGYVGVGTASPAGTLDVEGGTATTGSGTNVIINAQAAGTGNYNGGNITLFAGAATGTGAPGTVKVNANGINVTSGSATPGANSLAGSGFNGLYSTDLNRLDFATAGTNRMSVLANGNVTLSNSTAKVIANNFLDYATNLNGFLMDSTNAYIQTNGLKRVFVDPTGKVGIANATPAAYLDVIGTSTESPAIFTAIGSGTAATTVFKNSNAIGYAASFQNSDPAGYAATFRGISEFVQTSTSTNTILARTGAVELFKVVNPVSSPTASWNTAPSASAVIYVAKDSTTQRSINAAGTVNASGADFAEWVDWQGPKPEMGSVIKYRGAYVVVSSPFKAAFVGNDLQDHENGILIAFAGQLPVLVEGEVKEGDLIVGQENGHAKAVSKELATSADSKNAVGVAWEASTDRGVKRVNVAIGIGAASGHADVANLEKLVAEKEQDIVLLKRENEDVKRRLERLEKLLNTK